MVQCAATARKLASVIATPDRIMCMPLLKDDVAVGCADVKGSMAHLPQLELAEV